MSDKSLPSCLTLFDPIDRSLPGPSVRGVLQARIPEWVGAPSSRGSFCYLPLKEDQDHRAESVL